MIDEDLFATREIERLIATMDRPRDLLTRGDVAATKGRLLLQAMMTREKDAEATKATRHAAAAIAE